MRIGDLLVAANLVRPPDIDAAVKRQLAQGGRLGESLVALGAIKAEVLDAFLNQVPPVPMSVAETGISPTELLNLLMKIIFVRALETASSFAEAIQLPRKVVSELIDQAVASQLLLVLGSLGPSGLDDMRYGLSDKGRRWASEALAISAYTGPAPVSCRTSAGSPWSRAEPPRSPSPTPARFARRRPGARRICARAGGEGARRSRRRLDPAPTAPSRRSG